MFEMAAFFGELGRRFAAEYRIDERVKFAGQLVPLRIEIRQRDADVGGGFERAVAKADPRTRVSGRASGHATTLTLSRSATSCGSRVS